MARSFRIPILLSLLLGGALFLGACSDDGEADAGSDGDTTPTTTATADAGDADTEGDSEADSEGGADGDDEADAEAGSVAVTLSDFAIEVDPATVAAGSVTFDASNEGDVPHELTVIRTDEPADDLPVDGALVDTSELEVAGNIEEFAAGSSESGTFELESGRYVLICNVAGHYTLGMVTEFTVE